MIDINIKTRIDIVKKLVKKQIKKLIGDFNEKLLCRFSSNKSKHIFRGRLINPNSNSLENNIQKEEYNTYFIQEAQHTFYNNPAKRIPEKWGGRNPVFYNYDSSYLEFLSTSINVFDGFPNIKTFENVIYIPFYDCLYSIDGRRIDESCLKRPGLLMPSSIKVPRQLKEISEKFLFGGVLYRGYGHLLTDSINRLWYAAIVQQLPIIYFYLRERWEPKRTYIDIFFESASLDENRFVSFASPVLLKEVIKQVDNINLNKFGIL